MRLDKQIATAIQGLVANKLRSGLTMLGVMIGVASVIAMLSVGNGARKTVEESFRSLGSDQISISVLTEMEDGELVEVGQILSFEDGLRMPESVDQVISVDMSVRGNAHVRRDTTVIDVPVIGATQDVLMYLIAQAQVEPVGWPEDHEYSTSDLLGHGRFFTLEEVLTGAGVCVLGASTSDDLFQGEDPLGQTILVNYHQCQVIGELTELAAIDPTMAARILPNDSVYMPISTVIQQVFEDEPSVNMIAHVADESRIGETKNLVKDYLRQRHAIQPDHNGNFLDDFRLSTNRDVLGVQQEAARTFAMLLAAMAVISLVVGGIGIMNVEMVSVFERTREIGIRMAVGARQIEIIYQFLLESILLSVGGGVLGILGGILAIPFVSRFSKVNAVLAGEHIPFAFFIAVITGICFGIFPAIRASRLDPINALRWE